MSEWRWIKGYEELYEVSDEGTVRSYNGRWSDKGVARVLKSVQINNGYLKVSLCRGRHTEQATVHHLVAQAFLGETPAGMEIAHLNGNRQDARLANLRFTTHVENELHKVEHGTLRRGSLVANSKLSEEQARYVKKELACGTPYSRLMAELGISKSLLNRIKHGLAWGWLEA